MAYIAPNSTVWLYKGVPLDPNYENTYWFPTKSAQKAAFDNSYLAYAFNAQSYCRATGNAIRVQRNPDDLINCNYMAFKNTSFGNKIFYAFIDEVAYINNSTAEIRFTIDVLQTYFRDVIFMPSYIEREHSATDEIGDNIVPEPSIGSPHIIVNSPNVADENKGVRALISSDLMNNNYLVIATNAKFFLSSDLLDNRTPLKVQFPTLPGGKVLFFGDLVLVECNNIDSTAAANTLLTVLKRFVEAKVEYYDNSGKAVIEDMYIVPKACAYGLTWYATNPAGIFYETMRPDNAGSISIPLPTKSDSLDGYLPKNKKLYTAPFSFLRVTTNTGSYIDYPCEMIKGDKATFEWYGSCLYGAGRIFGGITNYKSSNVSLIDKTLNLEFNNHIQQPINPDNSLSYLWQDKVTNFGLHMASTAISLPFQMYNYNTRLNAAAKRAEKKGEEFTPEIPVPKPSLSASTGAMAGGQTAVSGCDLTKLYGRSNFYSMHMCYDKATLVQYDNYFTRYGYAVNKVKFPNFIQDKGRKTFNYIKTNGASIAAKDAPADAVEKMKQIFDSGTTVWLQLGNVGNFGLSNDPIK